MNVNPMRSLVVMSGGQDSTTCLGVALSKGTVPLAVSFDYGQKHAVELDAAKAICAKFGIKHQIINLRAILGEMRSSALVTHSDTSRPHEYLAGLPASFVPVRNALFLTAAYGLAMEIGADAIYTGVCETDYSGYPDCRHDFILHLNEALNRGYSSNIQIMTPLMWLDKADTFKLAADKGILHVVLEMSVTCYEGDNRTRNDWGLGCGKCPSCKLRSQGYDTYIHRYLTPATGE